MSWRGYDPWYVYELVDPRGDVVFYIGKTNTPNARFAAHRRDPASAAHYRLRVIAEAGFQGKMNVIGEFKTEEEALDYEAYLIGKTPGLVNRTGVYAAGRPPTKPVVRPMLDVGHAEYISDEPVIGDFERRAERLHQAMGGDVSEYDIQRILQTMDLLAHEDAEYEAFSDE